MSQTALKFNILAIARDFLYVEDFDFYPAQVWEDFEEALYLFLTDDEIDVLNYRYGGDEFCRFSVAETRRILSSLMLRFSRSEFYAEMDAVMSACESGEFENDYGSRSIGNDDPADEFVSEALAKIGLDHKPGAAGDLRFDSMISNFPVFVWRKSDVSVSLWVLRSMLCAAAEEGFGRFFMVASPRLTVDLPPFIDGCIPHTFIPLIDETFAASRQRPDDQHLTV